jgi:hypothetical protein
MIGFPRGEWQTSRMAIDRNRVAYICEHCGSSDVVSDARAAWDIQGQQWTLVGHYDASECLACGRDSNLIPVELAPEPQA